MTSGDLTFDLAYKMTEVIFLPHDFYALLNVTYRVPLCGTGVELGGIHSPVPALQFDGGFPPE